MSPPESRDLATLIDMIRACEGAMSFILGWTKNPSIATAARFRL
jgi:hypothetical protein